MPAKDQDTQRPYRRDYDMEKPGSPPRPKTEPAGAKESVRNDKTLTDPGTGEPTRSN